MMKYTGDRPGGITGALEKVGIMRFLDRLSFRSKIFLGITAVVLVFGVLSAVFVSRVATSVMLGEIQKRGLNLAVSLAVRTADPWSAPGAAGPRVRSRPAAPPELVGCRATLHQVTVDAKGRVELVGPRVHLACPGGPTTEDTRIEKARTALRQWKFRPVMVHGEPVTTTTPITVNFD